MIHLLINENYPIIAFIGILFAFVCTCLFTAKLKKYLPTDAGRDFAHDGKLSAGKPRGAGIIFTLVFAASGLIFANLSVELGIYIFLVVVEMLTGYLDDASDKPWGEWKKGLLDLLVAAVAAITYYYFNGSTIALAMLGIEVTIPPVIFILLAIILVWASINVTNCADGVDGLSGTLTIITLGTIYIISEIQGLGGEFGFLNLIFIVCILGYLWYNATPSLLLMGDAGSRAMGFFISIAILKTGSPFLYLLVAFVLLVDGGLGLVKVSLIRVFKIHILKNTRTPLHDHVRKILGWSNTQTVFRFAIIQIVISVAAVYIVMM
ncbi:MAG: phospho-N-acetylmuramoyl-pentapeptide-transferase [Lachnospiraceae bacterium]|nr:phospho-N-acetylmuramoyl-pentapeptide-transferase [Lachnospiraceae bacterium]